MKTRSMRARMTVGFLAAVAVLLTVTGAALLAFAAATNQNHTRELLDSTAIALRQELAAGRISVGRPQQLLEGDAAGFRASQLVLVLYDERNQFLLSSNRSQNVPFDDDWTTLTVVETPRRLVLGHSLQYRRREMQTLEKSLLLLDMIVLAASAIGAWFLVGRVLSPIDRLAEVARSAPVETTHLESPSQDAEVERLVSTLNDFLGRLRESNRQKERFYAAASHELRTPLQGLAGFLEIGLSRPRPRAELVEILGEAQEQSQRLVKLTADLLALSNIENTAPRQLERAEIDAADIIERALAPLENLRAARHLDLQIDLPSAIEEAEIIAPWSHLEMLVRNLVENAHKYACDGGAIRITFRPDFLTVANQVEWNSDELRALQLSKNSAVSGKNTDLETLFEPFFRLDNTREGQIGGNGLGLSICRAICDASNWRISLGRTPVENRPGFEVRVEFE